MKKNKVKITFIIIFCLLLGVLFYYTNSNSKTSFNITKDKEFGAIIMQTTKQDLSKLGYEFGDSVDLKFSNGKSLIDVPYYDGYYVRTGEPIVCAYPTYTNVYVNYCNTDIIWSDLNLSEDDTLTISINTKGKYKMIEEVLSAVYSNDREDYNDDESFGNFRSITGGNIKPNTIYRGASPIDDSNSRADIINELIREANINFILDLSDNETEVKEYMKDNDNADDYFFSELLDEDKVALLDMNMSFMNKENASKLANGLKKMLDSNGPYYIHCQEGKDRTGFVCVLLEALCNSTYEELENDYMLTYDAYYNINKTNSNDKYNAYKQLKFDEIIDYLTLNSDSIYEGAYNYLLDAGMSSEEINKLISLLTN